MQGLGLHRILLLQGLPYLALAKHIQAHAYAEHIQGFQARRSFRSVISISGHGGLLGRGVSGNGRRWINETTHRRQK